MALSALQSLKPRQRSLAIAVGALCSLAAVTAFGVAPLAESELPAAETLLEPANFNAQAFDPPSIFSQQETVRRGETLGTLMQRLGIADGGFAAFVRQDPKARRLLELRAGRSVSATVGEDGQLVRLSYRLSQGDDNGLGRRLVIHRAGPHFAAFDEAVPVERSVEMRSVEIGSSLVAAIDAADIPDNVITRMADIFGDDVDVNRGIRRGDRLRVVYETIREAGSVEPARVGRVLAVQLRSGPRKLEAVWYERPGNDGEYYTFDGKSLRRSFLTSPLEFSRVSSAFTESRLHPVTRDWRAHKGIDLRAPSGTNVRTIADGVIEYIGSQRGYGNVIIVRHNPSQTTLYAHLSDFTDGLSPGTRVRQGEVIGKVGMTGWATGPHLHFEFHVKGQHINPAIALAGANQSARALGPLERPRFADMARQYSARFELLDTQFAARFQ